MPSTTAEGVEDGWNHEATLRPIGKKGFFVRVAVLTGARRPGAFDGRVREGATLLGEWFFVCGAAA
jgi:hypothetical protein